MNFTGACVPNLERATLFATVSMLSWLLAVHTVQMSGVLLVEKAPGAFRSRVPLTQNSLFNSEIRSGAGLGCKSARLYRFAVEAGEKGQC